MCDEDRYDWDKSISQTITGKNICNQLLHSYVLQLLFEEDAVVIGFLFLPIMIATKGLLKFHLKIGLYI